MFSSVCVSVCVCAVREELGKMCAHRCLCVLNMCVCMQSGRVGVFVCMCLGGGVGGSRVVSAKRGYKERLIDCKKVREEWVEVLVDGWINDQMFTVLDC